MYHQQRFCYFRYITVSVSIFSKHYVPNKYLPIQAVHYFSMLPMLPMYFSSYACSHFQNGNVLVTLYYKQFYERMSRVYR